MGTRSTRAAQAHDGAGPVKDNYGVALRARIAQRNLDDLGEWIVAALPGLDAPTAREVVQEVALGRKGLSMLHQHLSTHPDALVSGDSDCPIVFLRFMRALVEAGYPVTPLRCFGCSRSGLTLNCRVAGGRLCGTCANRHRAQPCSQCGTVATVHARQDGKPVCLPCYEADPATARHCTQCGKPGHIAVRTRDDGRICRRCYQPPRQQCIHCGQIKLVNARTDAGPVCTSCHKHPPRRCDRCGTITKLATRSDAREDLCHACLPNRAHTRCHLCSTFGPWRASTRHGGQKTCPDCRRKTFTPPQRECALCHHARRIITTWPLGAVCGTCYKRVRTHPDACTRCGNTRILIGRDENGAGLCPQCCGTPDQDYRCTRCGGTGFFHRTGLCPRCEVHDRIHELLADDQGDIPAPLAPFAQALREADSPEAVLQWLRPGQPAATLLEQVATAGEPVSHELLDSCPQTLALHRLRQTLTHTGVLPDRADYLERLVPWLDNLLHDYSAEQAHLARTYVHWTLLRRARQRSRTRPFTPHAGNWLRTRVRATLNFLTWLNEQDLTLDTVNQNAIDQWLTATPTDATYAAREFLYWARQHDLVGEVSIPKRPIRSSLPPITEDDRWTQLRRCLHEQDLPTEVRAAGALVLLFGLAVSRITALRHSDVHTDADGTSWLQMTQHRLLLPDAVAALLHTQREHGTGTAMLTRTNTDGPRWLFPGGLPGRPARDALYRALRTHLPVHLRRARSAALAALAAELPAAVLANLLDLNINTANAWATYAQHDWTTYLAARTQTSQIKLR
jgi:hypothetical protein